MNYVLATLCFSVAIAVAQATVCKLDTDCSAGECCYIQPEFMVVSKRQVSLPLQPVHTKHDTGVCEKYKLEHAPCWPLEKANGHCSCGTGLSCQFVPAPTITMATAKLLAVSKRSIYMPGPGSYQCEKITTN